MDINELAAIKARAEAPDGYEIYATDPPLGEFYLQARRDVLSLVAEVERLKPTGEFLGLQGGLIDQQGDLIADLYAQIGKLEGEVERLRGERMWQRISTAPKDGTRILAWPYWKEHPVALVRWSESSVLPHWRTPGGLWGNLQPTHWMPLPAPPATDVTNPEAQKDGEG